jgi:hypothetical protein
MKQYFISDEYRDEIILWCRERMIQREHFQWFPMYATREGAPAFRLDIFNKADAVVFKLKWGHIIL